MFPSEKKIPLNLYILFYFNMKNIFYLVLFILFFFYLVFYIRTRSTCSVTWKMIFHELYMNYVYYNASDDTVRNSYGFSSIYILYFYVNWTYNVGIFFSYYLLIFFLAKMEHTKTTRRDIYRKMRMVMGGFFFVIMEKQWINVVVKVFFLFL